MSKVFKVTIGLPNKPVEFFTSKLAFKTYINVWVDHEIWFDVEFPEADSFEYAEWLAQDLEVQGKQLSTGEENAK